MAEMHGGGISAESTIDEGSKFTISLPWIESSTDTADTQSTEAEEQLALPVKLPGDKTPLVLLAEDKEENISLFTDYLESQGYTVIVARNGVEALERAQEETPDIILMDIQMPEMDGLEATRRIRANVDLVRIPVIAITALSMPGDRERCLAAGANEYMSKPINLRALKRTINAQLISAGEI
jgi:CheY-like chemotaxis protein